jgi:hypothetical protein
LYKFYVYYQEKEIDFTLLLKELKEYTVYMAKEPEDETENTTLLLQSKQYEHQHG